MESEKAAFMVSDASQASAGRFKTASNVRDSSSFNSPVRRRRVSAVGRQRRGSSASNNAGSIYASSTGQSLFRRTPNLLGSLLEHSEYYTSPATRISEPAGAHEIEDILEDLQDPKYDIYRQRTCKGGVMKQRCDEQMVWYDSRALLHFGSLISFGGTVITSPGVWNQLLAMIAVAFVVAGCLCLSTILVSDEEKKNAVQQYSMWADLPTTFEFLVNFVLSAYVALGIARWWQTRQSTLSQIWGTSGNLALLVGTFAKGKPADAKYLREKVIKYGLLTHALIYKEHAGEETAEHLQELVDRKLLTEEELVFLEPLHAKPLAVCGFMGRMVANARQRKVLDATDDWIWWNQIFQLRSAIGYSYASRCQLPLPYIHVICMLAKMLLLLQAVACGGVFGTMIANKALDLKIEDCGKNAACIEIVKDDAWGTLVTSFSIMVMYNLFYQGLIEIQRFIEDPFGGDDIDFPEYRYHQLLAHELLGLEEAPASYRQFTETASYNLYPKPKADREVEMDNQRHRTFTKLLSSLKLEEYARNLVDAKVSPQMISDLDLAALRETGIPLGPAIRIYNNFKVPK